MLLTNCPPLYYPPVLSDFDCSFDTNESTISLFNKPIYKWEDLGQVQSSDRQRNIIYYLIHQGKGRTEAVRFAGFAAPRQSAFTLTQSPNIITKIRQERNKVYQTELASTSVHTLKEVMEDTMHQLVQG